jgi:hypothetical protein
MSIFNLNLRTLRHTLPLWALSLFISILYLFHFQNINNDFQVFIKAGEYFLKKENSWSMFTDPNAMYLNGAGTLIFSSVLSLVPVNYGILLIRIANILVMLATSFLIGRRSSWLPVPGVFILILIIFPFRSAMEYGQFTILFTFLAFLLFENVVRNRSDSLMAVFCLALIVDFKPHVFVGLMILILVHKRVALCFKALGLWLVIQSIVGIWSHTIPVYEWYLAVKRRSGFVSQGEDNLSLTAHFGSTQFWLITAFSAIAFFHIWRHFRNSRHVCLAAFGIVSIPLIWSPLLHPTDFLLVALILLLHFNFSKFYSLLMGLLLVWSPLPSGAIFTLVIISLLYILLSSKSRPINKISFMVLIAPYLFYLIALNCGINEVSTRHLLQQSILIIINVRFLKINRKGLQPA